MSDDKKEKKEIRKATALKYDNETHNAPHVVATGNGYFAEQIIKRAKQENVAVIEDKKLATALSALNEGDEIPEELYGVVAEILVFINNLDNEYKDRLGLE